MSLLVNQPINYILFNRTFTIINEGYCMYCFTCFQK